MLLREEIATHLAETYHPPLKPVNADFGVADRIIAIIEERAGRMHFTEQARTAGVSNYIRALLHKHEQPKGLPL